MYTKEKINDWLQRLIDAKTTVITLLGITTNETVLNVFWDEWSELEGKLRQCNIQTFGKSIPDIKKMLLPTLLLIFFSSCQTQQREQSITQYETQTAIEAIHNAEKDRLTYSHA